MDRGRGGGGRDDFFGDPFGGFGGFGGGLGGGFGGGGIGGGFGGIGGQRSLVSSFFGGRDPFDDPFFNRPSMFGSSMFGPPTMFGPPSMFGPTGSGSMIGEAAPPSSTSVFIENQASQPINNKSKGPVIEEIVSDDDDNEEEEEDKGKGQMKENPRKHSRSKEPYVQEPDDEAEERKNRHLQYRNEYNRADVMQPRTQSFSFQSSSVTYGGTNGAYYTSSTTRKMGNDGVLVEESKEADTTTRKASHRLSRGIRDKGHSVTRNLNPDGKVDTMQTLHNLNEDELPVFEEAWKGSARKHLPGWNEGFDLLGNTGSSRSGQQGQGQVQNGGWALPSTEQPQIPDRPYRTNSSNGRTQ